jgi:outer membrane protein assembly factor BamB
MTAITRPPLAPLYADNSADFYATFAPVTVGNLSVESVIGFNSATMQPVVGISEKSNVPQQSVAFGAPIAASPPSGILVARANWLAGTLATLVYRTDGRKFRSATIAGPVFLNAHASGRVLAVVSPSFATRDPFTLAAESADVTFAVPSGMPAITVGVMASDRSGDVATIFTSTAAPANALLGYWLANGNAGWQVPFLPPSGKAFLSFVQIEFDPAGNIYTLCQYSAGGSGFADLRQFSPTGTQNWSVSFNGLANSMWVTADNLVFVATALIASANVYAYSTAGGSLIWSQNIGGVAANSVCEVSGKLLFGTHPVTASGVTNLWQLNRTTGATINQFAIGSTLGFPFWLEPRAGRLGTFTP